jgi:hypothetical protein
LLPWLAVYFVGLAIGKQRLAMSPAAGRRRLALLSLGATTLGAGLWLGRRALTRATGWPTFGSLLYRFLSPLDKYPPGLVYLLAFGGIAIGLFALMDWLAHETPSRIPAILAPVGRASLFTFVVQALLIQRVLPALHPAMHATWPLWFVGCSLVLYVSAWWWQRHDLNRLFTLGLARLDADARRGAPRERRAPGKTSIRSR